MEGMPGGAFDPAGSGGGIGPADDGTAAETPGASGETSSAGDEPFGDGSDIWGGCYDGMHVAVEPLGAGKVDFIWVVDTSGSMLDEQPRVVSNLEAFGVQLAGSGLDYRVVGISASDFVLAGSTLARSGRYRFVAGDVGSAGALQQLQKLHDRYSAFLREDAALHIIVVTDDESDYPGDTPDERAEGFAEDTRKLLGRGFVLHAVVSEDTGGHTPCVPTDPEACPSGLMLPGLCGGAAPGLTYAILAGDTGGIQVSICRLDWGPPFASLLETLARTSVHPCRYAVPARPDTQPFDRDMVNVQLVPEDGEPEIFGRVDEAQSCEGHRAWYYDVREQPSEISLCPEACDLVEAGGELQILFGCWT